MSITQLLRLSCFPSSVPAGVVSAPPAVQVKLDSENTDEFVRFVVFGLLWGDEEAERQLRLPRLEGELCERS